MKKILQMYITPAEHFPLLQGIIKWHYCLLLALSFVWVSFWFLWQNNCRLGNKIWFMCWAFHTHFHSHFSLILMTHNNRWTRPQLPWTPLVLRNDSHFYVKQK